MSSKSSAASTSGALLCGGLVSFWLYGIQTLQAYIYFKRYPNDRKHLKWLVTWVMLVDTIHTVFTGHTVYHFTIEESGQVGMRPKAWSFNTNIALTGIIAFTCQCFLARKAYKLNATQWHRYAALVIAVLALLPLSCTLACFVIMVIIREPSLYAHCTIIIGTWLASTAVVDVLLALYLSMSLYESRTGISRTDDFLTRLIKFTIHTAALTAGLAFADLGTFYALGNVNLIHWAINLTIGKSFINSLLASLNSRRPSHEFSSMEAGEHISFGQPFRFAGDSSVGVNLSTDTTALKDTPKVAIGPFDGTPSDGDHTIKFESQSTAKYE